MYWQRAGVSIYRGCDMGCIPGMPFHFSDDATRRLVSGMLEPSLAHFERFFVVDVLWRNRSRVWGGHVSHSELSSRTMYHIVAIFQ